MTLFFALLSLLALLGALGLVVLMVRAGGRTYAVREFGSYALPTAAVVATISMLGSLYMSEIEGFIPCRLCWIQRGFMYPLALFLIIATIRRWSWAALVGMVLAGIGAAVSAFHYAEQKELIGGNEGFCDAASPCTDVWVNHFGFISIPFMTFTGFVFVGALMWMQIATSRSHRSQ
jgi:disulfide bond formation protein DsbB